MREIIRELHTRFQIKEAKLETLPAGDIMARTRKKLERILTLIIEADELYSTGNRFTAEQRIDMIEALLETIE